MTLGRSNTLAKLVAVVVLAALGPVAEARVGTPYAPECDDDFPLPAEAWIGRMTNGWRPLMADAPGSRGPVNEIENARVVFQTFVDAGYPASIAFAAVVNAKSESSFDNFVQNTNPFYWNGVDYPYGTGAIGLFQLLPSQGGAGGPSGPEQGYSRTFQGGRWAGTAEQARLYGDTPDPLGRMYYDATNPRINTERIILEVERDGDELIAAAARGASIAELADIFGRDIERPQHSTFYRRELAAMMLGAELAYARNPDLRFAPTREDVAEVLFDLESNESPVVDEVGPAVTAVSSPDQMLFAGTAPFAGIALLVGLARRFRPAVKGAVNGAMRRAHLRR